VKNILTSTIFLAIVAALLWSTAFAGVKIGLQHHTPLQFGSFRFILAGLMVLAVFGRWERYWKEVGREWRFLLLMAFIQVIVQYGIFYTAMDLVPGAVGAMIVGSSPLFIAMIAHFTHPDDKMSFSKTIPFLTGVAGIAVITIGRRQIEMKSSLEWVGIALLIINNFASGYGNVLVSRNSRPLSPYVLTSASMLGGGILLYIMSLPLEGFHHGPFPAEYYGSLIWLSFVSAAAFSIWYSLLKRPGVKVSELNVWKFLIPVSGAGLSWLLIKGEKPDWMTVTGMVVIAGSLLLMNAGRGKKSLNLRESSAPPS
jgi:drug/metabolite transporter (DMT)-like permease